jgi:MATE family multidrug resistance protein
VANRPHTLASRLPEIWRLAWPHFIGNASITISFVAGNALVGRLGVEQLAALGIAFGLLVPVNTSLMTMVGASTAVFAEAIARHDGEIVRRHVWQLLWLIVGVAMAMGCLCLLLPASLAMLGVPLQVREIVLPYMAVSVAGIVPLSLLVILAAVLAAYREIKFTMKLELAVAIGTVSLTAMLASGHGPMPPGALALALSILAAHSAAALILFAKAAELLRTREGVELKAPMAPRLTLMREAASVGGPLALATLLRLGSRVVVVGVAASAGTIDIAAYQLANNLLDTYILPIVSIASVIPIILGHVVARKPEALFEELWPIVGVMASACTVLVGCLLLWAVPLLGLFTSNARVQAASLQSIAIIAVFLVLRASITVSDGCLAVARRTSVTPYVSFIGNWCVSVPCALLLSWFGMVSSASLLACLAAGTAFIAAVQMARAIKWLAERRVERMAPSGQDLPV